MADIFVSYTASDREQAFWLAHELKGLAHSPHVHEWEVPGGADIYAWMENRLQTADYVLCVLSDEYLKAEFSTLERNAALWQAAKSRPGFVLLVAVKPCKVPALSDHLSRCELFGLPQEAARVRFREFMSARAAPDAGHHSRSADIFAAVAASNIPVRVPAHFMGRDDALSAIESALNRYEGRVAITALHGLRGVGKTTLAAAYADRHRSDYRATWWIRAQSEITMRSDLVALGIRLRWVGQDEKEEQALATVMERLCNEGEGLLLIFDNAMDADGLEPFLPRGGNSRVLITSNAHSWRGIAEPVEIRLWPKEIGADYLILRTGREGERAAAEALSDTLGGLPLAHEQAAYYCERLGISLSEYGERFASAPTRLLDSHAPRPYHDGLTVAKTFALAIEQAAKLHAAAEPLITHAALLAPEPIPLMLFSEGRQEFEEPLASLLAGDGLDEAVAALRVFALIEREAIPDAREPSKPRPAIRLHRLVREVAASRVSPSTKDLAAMGLLKALSVAFPEGAYNYPQSWGRCASLITHVLSTCDLVPRSLHRLEPAQAEENAAHANLQSAAASYLYARAAYPSAIRLYERALAIRESLRGSQHPEIATSLNDLAVVLQAHGDLAGARPLFERALAINEKALGHEHPDTAANLHNLASLLRAQGDLAGARKLYDRALAILEKSLGAEHPETAVTLNNFGRLLQDQGELTRARSLFERAIAINEKALGPEHPDTATNLNNLARLLQEEGDLLEARTLYERVLATRQKVLGPEHPQTARALHDFATLRHAQGDHAEAQSLFERALAIREKVLGAEHPLTAATLHDLGTILQKTGDPAAARQLLERALAIRQARLGAEHPDTIASQNSLAVLGHKQADVGRVP